METINVLEGVKKYGKELKFLCDLYDQINNRPRFSMVQFCKNKKVAKNYSTVILAGGLIKNIGSQAHPNYVWATKFPDVHMAQELSKRVSKYNREVIRNSSKKRPLEAITKDEAELIAQSVKTFERASKYPNEQPLSALTDLSFNPNFINAGTMQIATRNELKEIKTHVLPVQNNDAPASAKYVNAETVAEIRLGCAIIKAFPNSTLNQLKNAINSL